MRNFENFPHPGIEPNTNPELPTDVNALDILKAGKVDLAELQAKLAKGESLMPTNKAETLKKELPNVLEVPKEGTASDEIRKQLGLPKDASPEEVLKAAKLSKSEKGRVSVKTNDKKEQKREDVALEKFLDSENDEITERISKEKSSRIRTKTREQIEAEANAPEAEELFKYFRGEKATSEEKYPPSENDVEVGFGIAGETRQTKLEEFDPETIAKKEVRKIMEGSSEQEKEIALEEAKKLFMEKYSIPGFEGATSWETILSKKKDLERLAKTAEEVALNKSEKDPDQPKKKEEEVAEENSVRSESRPRTEKSPNAFGLNDEDEEAIRRSGMTKGYLSELDFESQEAVRAATNQYMPKKIKEISIDKINTEKSQEIPSQISETYAEGEYIYPEIDRELEAMKKGSTIFKTLFYPERPITTIEKGVKSEARIRNKYRPALFRAVKRGLIKAGMNAETINQIIVDERGRSAWSKFRKLLGFPVKEGAAILIKRAGGAPIDLESEAAEAIPAIPESEARLERQFRKLLSTANIDVDSPEFINSVKREMSGTGRENEITNEAAMRYLDIKEGLLNRDTS